MLEDVLKKIVTGEPTMQRPTRGIDIKEWGRREYGEALAWQQQLREQRLRDEIPDTVVFTEHEPVYTLGNDLADEHSLLKGTLPALLVKIERGGKITYHGPGQVIVYFIFKVPFQEIGTFIDSLEDAAISTLQHYGIQAYSRKNEHDHYGKKIRGAWCQVEGQHKKIAAQGLELQKVPLEKRNVVTMHGMALNVSTDLAYFRHIHPCGFTYDAMSSMQEILGRPVRLEEVQHTLKRVIGQWDYQSP